MRRLIAGAFILGLVGSCSSTSMNACDVSTCPVGCCDSTGACQPGTTDAICGRVGAMCTTCMDPAFCSAGECKSTGAGGGAGGTGGDGTGGGFAGGGGQATGGGSAVGGGSAAGGGSSTGGGTAAASTSAFVDLGTGSTNGEQPEVAVSADGVIHVLYDGFTGTASGQPARYGECASNCGVSSSWHFVTVAQMGGLGEFTRLGLDASGHPRIVFIYQTTASGSIPEWHYGTCSTGCAMSASNWTVAPAYNFSSNGGTIYASGRHNFAVDAQGHPHLIFPSYEAGQNLTTYLTCTSGCDSATTANWTAVALDPSNQLEASVATTSTGGLRAVFTGTSDSTLYYRQCDTNCAVAASWTAPLGLYYSGGGGETRIRVDAQNHLRMAWYQGVSGVPAAAATDNLLLYGWCDGTCTDAAHWTGLTIGTVAEEGKEGFDLALDSTSTPIISYVSNSTALSVALCSGSCNTASETWNIAGNLETTDSVAAETPAPLPTCTSGVPMGFWYPGYDSSVAITPTGGAVIVHQTQELQSCGSGPTEAVDLIRVHLLQ